MHCSRDGAGVGVEGGGGGWRMQTELGLGKRALIDHCWGGGVEVLRSRRDHETLML